MSDIVEGQIVVRGHDELETTTGSNIIPAALNRAQIQVLMQRTPPEAIKYRDGCGGAKQAYVEGAWVTKQLNEAFGWDWDFSVVREFISEGKNCAVLGRLTVRAPNGATVIKEQYGECNWLGDLGNTLKGAATDAKKKCAAELGIGLDLMSKDEREISSHPMRIKYWEAVNRDGLDLDRALRGDAWAIEQFERSKDPMVWKMAIDHLRKG